MVACLVQSLCFKDLDLEEGEIVSKEGMGVGVWKSEGIE